MNVIKLTILGLLIFNSSFLLGQTIEELKKDKSIVWIGEVFVDYSTNLRNSAGNDADEIKLEKLGIKGRNSFKILKFSVSDVNDCSEDDHILLLKIIRKYGSQCKIYKDHNLAQKMSVPECYSIGEKKDKDTITTFNPETYEETIEVIVHSYNSDAIHFLRLKQQLYYDSKDLMFRTVPVSIAPMITYYDNKGNFLRNKPLFWMPVGIATKSLLKNENVDWAKRIYRDIEFKDIKTIKGKGANESIKAFFKSIEKRKGNVLLGGVFDADGRIPFSKEEILDMVDWIKKNYKEISSMRLIQDWYWNDGEFKLYIQPIGFGPIVNYYDADGKLHHTGVLFNRREDFVDK